MPKFSVTAPDGAVYDVDGPGTEAEAIAFVQKQHAQSAEPMKPVAMAVPPPPPETSAMSDFGQGAKASFDRAALGVKGLLPQSVQDAGDWVDRQFGDKQMLNKQTAVGQPDSMAGMAGGVLADVGLTAPAFAFGGAVPGALRGVELFAPMMSRAEMLAGALRGANPGAMRKGAMATAQLAPSLAGNAAVGAAMSPEDRGAGAMAGAGGALAGHALQRTLGGVFKPMMSDEARALSASGKVVPTVGQSLGGFANRVEQRMQSVPVVGDMITHSRQRSGNEWNREMIDNVAQHLPPEARSEIAKAATPDDALLSLRYYIGKKYEGALGGIDAMQIPAGGIISAANAAMRDAGNMLTPESKNRIVGYVNDHILSRQGTMTGDAAKKIESDLGKNAYGFAASATQEERQIGEVMGKIHDAWRESLTSAANAVDPVMATELRRADAMWRAFLPLDKAAGSAVGMNNAGRSSPVMLKRALAQLDKSQNDNAMRRIMHQGSNGTPYENLVQSTGHALPVLGGTVPDSGTAARLAQMAGLGGAAHLAGALPGTVAAGALGVAAYTRVGQKFLQMGVKPEMTQEFLQWLGKRGVPEEAALQAIPNLVAAFTREQGVHQ